MRQSIKIFSMVQTAEKFWATVQRSGVFSGITATVCHPDQVGAVIRWEELLIDVNTIHTQMFCSIQYFILMDMKDKHYKHMYWTVQKAKCVFKKIKERKSQENTNLAKSSFIHSFIISNWIFIFSNSFMQGHSWPDVLRRRMTNRRIHVCGLIWLYMNSPFTVMFVAADSRAVQHASYTPHEGVIINQREN